MNEWTIEAFLDIPRLPPLGVLLELEEQIDVCTMTRPVPNVFPAVLWTGLGGGKSKLK